MNGFVYDYQETAPGPKVANQQALVEELTIQITNKDDYENDRIRVCNKFFTFQDSNSSRRIFENLLQ
jgi:CDP-glycerol glycerophosphotransferase (TagB/SpsB family)